MPDDPNRPAKPNALVTAARYSEIGFIIPAAVFLGYGLGWLLDRWLHTHWLFIAGVIFAYFVPPGDGTAILLNVRLFHGLIPESALGILDALLGAAFGSLLLWGAAALYKVIRGREGMGFGDVKMMAMVGTFLGLRGSFITILLGTLLGSILGLALILALYAIGWKRRLAERASRRGLGKVRSLRWAIATQYQLPLGTFLGIGALVVVFLFSSPVINLTTRTP